MTKEMKLALAPMAGITDKAFREICQDWGCDITWSEMVSSEGLVRNPLENNKSLALAEKYSDAEKDYRVQIFGNNPKSMALSAKIIAEKIYPRGIDINLGCPVKKAQKAGYGAVQMKEIDRVCEIIQEIKKSIDIPLSLKTRVGIENPREILDFAPKLEKAGINQLVVHARTLKGMFFETPHWEIVKELREILKIEMVYNGGIKTFEDAQFYQDHTGCDTLMIGQGAFGKPWVFWQVKNSTQNLPSKEKMRETILKHANLVLKHYGEHGLVTFRTHLSAYLRGIPHSGSLRQEAVRVQSLSDVENIVLKF